MADALKTNGLVTVECEGTTLESGVDSLARLRRTVSLSLPRVPAWEAKR